MSSLKLNPQNEFTIMIESFVNLNLIGSNLIRENKFDPKIQFQLIYQRKKRNQNCFENGTGKVTLLKIDWFGFL